MTTPTPTSPTCAECDHECESSFGPNGLCCNCILLEHDDQCYKCQNVNEAAYEHATTPAYGNGDH